MFMFSFTELLCVVLFQNCLLARWVFVTTSDTFQELSDVALYFYFFGFLAVIITL